MNMFTGVVVESFAYVYQRPGGVSVNREELSQFFYHCSDQKLIIVGAFKKVWSSIDTERTGYIKRKDYIRFFSVPRSITFTPQQLMSSVSPESSRYDYTPPNSISPILSALQSPTQL
jgi:hypothetical protein